MAVITGEVDRNCILTFSPTDLLNPKDFYSREISGAFSEDFTISPRVQNYDLTVICSNLVVYSDAVNLPQENYKLNLGLLAL